MFELDLSSPWRYLFLAELVFSIGTLEGRLSQAARLLGVDLLHSSRAELGRCSSGFASRISMFLDLFYSLLCFHIADLFPIKISSHFWVWCCLSYLLSSCFDLYSLYFTLQIHHREELISLGMGSGSSSWFCGQGRRLPHRSKRSVLVTVSPLELCSFSSDFCKPYWNLFNHKGFKRTDLCEIHSTLRQYSSKIRYN